MGYLHASNIHLHLTKVKNKIIKKNLKIKQERTWCFKRRYPIHCSLNDLVVSANKQLCILNYPTFVQNYEAKHKDLLPETKNCNNNNGTLCEFNVLAFWPLHNNNKNKKKRFFQIVQKVYTY